MMVQGGPPSTCAAHSTPTRSPPRPSARLRDLSSPSFHLPLLETGKIVGSRASTGRIGARGRCDFGTFQAVRLSKTALVEPGMPALQRTPAQRVDGGLDVGVGQLAHAVVEQQLAHQVVDAD